MEWGRAVHEAAFPPFNSAHHAKRSLSLSLYISISVALSLALIGAFSGGEETRPGPSSVVRRPTPIRASISENREAAGGSSSRAAMASKASSTASASKSEPPADPQTNGGQDVTRTSQNVMSLIDSFKKQVINDRYNFIKKKMEENKQKLCGITNHIYHLSTSRHDTTNGTDVDLDLLARRKENVLCTLNGLDQANEEKDNGCGHEDSSYASSAVLSGNNYGGKNAFRPIKLPEVPKLPPYTTWIFLDRWKKTNVLWNVI